jgi:hypothetical protein
MTLNVIKGACFQLFCTAMPVIHQHSRLGALLHGCRTFQVLLLSILYSEKKLQLSKVGKYILDAWQHGYGNQFKTKKG